MIRWNLCVLVCAMAFALAATRGVLAEQTGGEEPAHKATDGEATGAAIGPHAMVRVAVRGVLNAQQEAWNRGDIPAFMEFYWKSDDLTFSSGGKTTRGWQATLDNYKERYPTREKMGQVTFREVEITPLGHITEADGAAMVLGQWLLDREREPIGGNFTLVFRKIDDRWLIVHDHTSRLME